MARHLGQADQSQGGLGFAHLAVDAQGYGGVFLAWVEAADGAHSGRQGVVVGGDATALGAVDDLGGVEGEHLGVAQAADAAAAVGTGNRVAGIEGQAQVVLGSQDG